MSEHPHSPEEFTPDEATELPRGMHDIPDDHALESEYSREVLRHRFEQRIAELAPETRAAIAELESLHSAIQSHQSEASVAGILEDEVHVYQEFKDVFTAYKNGNTDEEEVQISANKILDALRSIQSMIRLDRDVPPTE